MIRFASLTRPILLLSCLAGLGGWLGSCSSTDSSYSSGRPYVPEVSMPTDLNRNEEELLPEVADALRQAGFDPSRGSDAEYVLGFSVEDGPINADTSLRLQRGRREVARSFARVGGPRIIFKRRQVIHESFAKALRQFESQLPQLGGGGGRDGGRGEDWDAAPRNDYRDSERGTADYDTDIERGTPYEDQR